MVRAIRTGSLPALLAFGGVTPVFMGASVQFAPHLHLSGQGIHI